MPSKNFYEICDDCNAEYSTEHPPTNLLEERCPRCQQKLLEAEESLRHFCSQGRVELLPDYSIRPPKPPAPPKGPSGVCIKE